MYKALYRKWRPLKFDDVISQKHITDTLRNQVINNKTAHAYLFTGSRGTGKTTCARILAKAVNCKSILDGNPCLDCDICRDADNGILSDIVEIDAASNNGVEDIRELRDGTVYTPERCSYKVYIIDEVHMLSPSAFNALLKIMEEPPDYVKFILATTEIHKVPATIVSRCQRYDFRRIKTEDIAKRLLYIAEKENINLTEEAAFLIARLADGGMRDAISLLDQCSVCSEIITPESVSDTAGIAGRDYLYDILNSLSDKDISKTLEIINNLYEKSKDLTRLCEELIMQFRNMMLIKVSPQSAESLITAMPDEIQKLKGISEKLDTDRIILILDILQECYVKMSKSLSKRIELEMTAVRLCSDIKPAENIQTVQTVHENSPELIEKIKKLEHTIAEMNGEIVKKPIKNNAVAEPKPSVDLKNIKIDEIPEFEPWQRVMEEFRKINPSVAASLENSYAQSMGNVVFITANNRWFINLFGNKEHVISLGEAIYKVTGERFLIRARCLTTMEEQKNMAESLVEKAKNSGIETAVE